MKYVVTIRECVQDPQGCLGEEIASHGNSVSKLGDAAHSMQKFEGDGEYR